MLLFVVACALAFAYLLNEAGNKVDVLAMRAPVSAGEVVQRSDLTTAAVAGDATTMPVSAASSVVGKTATTDLVPGQLLVPDMVTARPVPGPEQSTVGLALLPQQMPTAGLRVGDAVTVLAVPPAEAASEQFGSPQVLVDAATVYSVSGAPTAGGQRLLTLLVPESAGATVAGYAAAQRVAVIETAPGPGEG